MAFALALGILVADLANVHTLSAVNAQSAGSASAIAEATVVGTRIAAHDVIIDGVPTSAVFVGSVVVVDSMMLSGDTAGLSGVNVGDYLAPPSATESGDDTQVGGVNVGDGLMANGVNVGDGSPAIFGGTVEGDGVKVVDGVITGENLRVVGAVVSGGGVSSVTVTATGTSSTPIQ
jgi:hypothetical protein